MKRRKKTFVLGVGCQKGGSSWLNRYLREHTSSKLGIMKEYHVFDALYVKGCGNWYLDAVKHSKTDKNSMLRQKFIENTDEYFDYFTNILSTSGKNFTADITPSYAGLPDYGLQEIKSGFENRGIDVKVVFFMRDPFERVYSYCRKGIRNNKLDYDKTEYLEEQSLLNNYASWGCEFRTKYDITIKNLEKVFYSKDIFYGFYENLFTDETIKKLTDFLDIPFEKGKYNEKVNLGQTPQTFDKKVYEKIIANHYRDTYFFLYDKFGRDFIDGIWKSSKHIRKKRCP